MGACIAAAIKKYPILNNSLHLEAIAIIEGIKLASEKAIRNIIVEGDSKAVFDTIICNNIGPSHLQFLIKDICGESSENDRIADLLAKHEKSLYSHMLWMDYVTSQNGHMIGIVSEINLTTVNFN